MLGPGVLIEDAWRNLTASYSVFDLTVWWSAFLHLAFIVILNFVPFILQFIPAADKYRLQPNRPTGPKDWLDVAKVIFASQLFIQTPLIYFNYHFFTYFDLPVDYDSMPTWYSVLARCFLCMVIEDFWHYVWHRILHHKSIYRYIHKLHHKYTNPFAFEAEYAHPIETIILGGGFFIGILLFCDHLIFMWSWLFIRLWETTEAHSGYSIPLSPFHLIPGYGGAAFHDFHHKAFDANFASTFTWWDKVFGTDELYWRHERELALRKTPPVLEFSTPEKCAAAREEVERAVRDRPLGHKSLPPKHCVVTGGNGLVGSILVKMLVERGAEKVVSLDLQLPKEHEALTQEMPQVEFLACDITNKNAVIEALRGADIVYHLAALVGPFHPKPMYEKVNYEGTLNIVAGCRENGIGRLVMMSSPSTRFQGGDIWNLSESDLDYPKSYLAEYARTKAMGEQAVFEQCDADLHACAVAPHQVYGDTDRLFLPNLLEAAQTGRLRIFGSGENVVSFTHVRNISHACILAGNHLGEKGSETVGSADGQFFFITDGGGKNFWDSIDHAVLELGLPSLWSKYHLPRWLLWSLAYLSDAFSATLNGGRKLKLNSFTVRMMLIHRFFDIQKARDLIGYRPIVSFEEGWRSAIKHAVQTVNDPEWKASKNT